MAPGWVLQESSIALEGDILTEINAVCYMSKPVVKELESHDRQVSLAPAQSDYYAVLGHVLVYTSADNSNFPPSTSWLVAGQYIKWTSGYEGLKKLNLMLTRKLKDGNACLLPKYNIYVQHLDDNMEYSGGLQEASEYLGVAEVEAFLRF